MKRETRTATTLANVPSALQDAGKVPFPGPPRPPIGHVLKCWPLQFEDILCGMKPFTIRKDDRDYQRGDTVVLVEYDPETKQHTGRSLTRMIGYLGRGAPYPDGHCAFMLEYGEPAAVALPNPMRGRC